MEAMNDTRNIRSGGQELGAIGIAKLQRMLMRGGLAQPVEFWSEAAGSWMPIAGLIFDFAPDRVMELRASGITQVGVIGAGDGDCPACSAIIGKSFPIDGAPKIPPANCTCVPWCRLTVIAEE